MATFAFLRQAVCRGDLPSHDLLQLRPHGGHESLARVGKIRMTNEGYVKRFAHSAGPATGHIFGVQTVAANYVLCHPKGMGNCHLQLLDNIMILRVGFEGLDNVMSPHNVLDGVLIVSKCKISVFPSSSLVIAGTTVDNYVSQF